MNEALAQWLYGEGSPEVLAVPPDIARVLLIEDDDDDAVIVESLMAEASMEVRFVRARTLREGLEALPGGFDCVLLDLGLPDATGLQSLGRVRAAAPGVAVIVLTGLDDERAGEAAVAAGAQDYLVKGQVDGGLLARAIRYAIGRRHAEQVDRQLYQAEVHAAENERLERGLVPHPLVRDRSIWAVSRARVGRRRALLGGDFFDVVETVDGRLNLIIGDVCGRGPDEAALGAALRIAWRALILSGADTDLVLATLDQMLEHERQGPRTFATLCAIEIPPPYRSLCLRRAGHPPPVLIDGGSVMRLPAEPGAAPLGLCTPPEWPEVRVDLSSSWALLLYTDGLIEGHDGGSERVGEDGLLGLIGEYLQARPGWRRHPDGLLGYLITRAEELNGEELSDDVAMLLVGRPAVAGLDGPRALAGERTAAEPERVAR